MMQLGYCDWCGKDLKLTPWRMRIGADVYIYDLCDECKDFIVNSCEITRKIRRIKDQQEDDSASIV